MNPLLLKTLEKYNSWLKNENLFPKEAMSKVPKNFIPRINPKIEKWHERKKANLIIGARQVGKSTLIWKKILERGIAPLLINVESPIIREWCQEPILLLSDINDLIRDDQPVFFQEIQHLDEAGLLIKGLIDAGIKNPILITGSSSFHLRAKTKESLAGRATRIQLHPLSLQELANTLPDEQPKTVRQSSIVDMAQKQLQTGSYPAVWLSKEPAGELNELVEAFVLRDASDNFEIKHLAAFEKMMRLIAFQVGDLVNVDALANECEISRTAIDNYISILVDSHIIFKVSPFVGGKRAEIKSRPKIYYADNGILNVLTGQLKPFELHPNRGKCLENYVAAELKKHIKPLAPSEHFHYWRRKGKGLESDFVLDMPNGLIGLEVKAAHLKKPKLERSARSFIEAYQPKHFIVVNTGFEGTDPLNDTTIQWVTPSWFGSRDFMKLLDSMRR
jgi:predicted AAA+ superfamily ATPase